MAAQDAPGHSTQLGGCLDEDSASDEDDIPPSSSSSSTTLPSVDGIHLRNGPFRGLMPSRITAIFQPAVYSLTAARDKISNAFGFAFPYVSAPTGVEEDHGQPQFDHGRMGNVRIFLSATWGIFLSSWMNLLLFFVPLGFVSAMLSWNVTLTFGLNVLAVVPLSALLTEATEQIASDAGDTLGALLNISLGNFVELILFVALKHNHIGIVQASILGSILVNLLLILGSALLVNSWCRNEAMYSTTETQLLSCLLFVSVFVFLIPVAFDFTFEEASESGQAILKMSRISALMVLAIYCLYFVHEVRSRSSASSQDLHAGENADLESNRSIALPELPHTVARGSPQPLPPRTIRFEDESVDGAAPGTNATVHKDIDVPSGQAEENFLREDVAANDLGSAVSGFPDEIDEQEARGRGAGPRSASHVRRREATSTDAFIRSRPHSRSISSARGGRPPSRESSTPASAWAWERQQRGGLWSIQGLANGRASTESLLHERPTHFYRTRTRADKAASIFMLFFSSGLMSLCAEFLVGAIDDVTHQVGLSESFIGLIILPIVGNLAEYVTVVSVATRAKLDLAVAVAVGSSIQIALCVSPLTILAGWAMHRDLSLTFDVFEMATLLGTVLLVNLLVLGGGNTARTNGLKGSLMCACYTIISLGSFLALPKKGETA